MGTSSDSADQVEKTTISFQNLKLKVVVDLPSYFTDFPWVRLNENNNKKDLWILQPGKFTNKNLKQK